MQSDRVPDTMTGSGATLHATTWTTFDRRYGPLFDGSAFSPTNPTQPYYGPGMNTPITHFYSTFFESWPIHMLDPVYGFDADGPGRRRQRTGPTTTGTSSNSATSSTFFQTLPDVWDAFTDGYKQGLRNVMADWVQHAQDKGWTKTAFETYHNHKYSYDRLRGLLGDGGERRRGRLPGRRVLSPAVAGRLRAGQLPRRQVALPHRHLRPLGPELRPVGQPHQLLGHGQRRSRARTGRRSSTATTASTRTSRRTWMPYSDSPSTTGSGLASAQIILRRWSQGFTGVLPYWSNFNGSWTGFADPPGVIYSRRRACRARRPRTKAAS